ncbi:septation ring formation regulator EzrA [Limosilactobacillus oris]|nr:septation ring formation regulator EzrA [Limosilactobacillus oris]
MMFQILIAILVIVLLLLLGIVWFQRRAIQQISELQAVSAHLSKQPLAANLKKAQQMQLVGDARDQLTKLQKEYDQLAPAIKRLNKQGEDLRAAVKTSQLVTINSAISDYREAIEKASKQADRLQKQLRTLHQQEENHHEAVDQLKQRYQQYHQQLDDKSFEYGETTDQLNERLADLEDRYAKFTDLTTKGDLEAAQEILTDLQADNQEFDDLLKKVPQLYKPLVAEFPDQLAELRSGYETLTKQHYHFTEKKLGQKIDQLQAKLTQTVKQLTDLQVDVVEQSNQDLSTEIDHLYDVMQKELDAKPEAQHLMKVMGEFISHARRQNDELTKELKRLNLSYTFNNNEIEAARRLDERIKAIDKDYQRDVQAIKDNQALYSQILASQKANQQELTAVEEKQREINDEVAKLQTDEQRAKKMLQRYSVDIRTIKRQVEQLNLPGLSTDYLDYFKGVSDEIKKLAAALGQYKVDMDDVTKQLIMVEADLETLHTKTNDLRDSVELTERLLQYSNRFPNDETVEKAAQEARQLFSEYEYAKSLEKIGTALEEVEPGSFKRLEDSYYNENH